jgi:hypothetical protein
MRAIVGPPQAACHGHGTHIRSGLRPTRAGQNGPQLGGSLRPGVAAGYRLPDRPASGPARGVALSADRVIG